LITRLSPEDIFEAFLYKLNSEGRNRFYNDKTLHTVFYQAKKEFPAILECYEFELKTTPISVTLDRMFPEFRHSGLIDWEDGKVVIKDSGELKKPELELEKVAKFICDRLAGN